MQSNNNIKEQIVKELIRILDEKIEAAQNAIIGARESRDNDTKSSMGDKYETSRSMVQIELEKYEAQLNRTEKHKNDVLKLNIQKKYNEVVVGSMVLTKAGTYFISIGHGKVEIDGKPYFCISMASPIGQALQGKKIGEKVVFQGREIVVVDVL